MQNTFIQWKIQMLQQTTMAWCWQQKGEPDTLIKSLVMLPTLQADDVLIENRVIALNPVDWKLISWGHQAWAKGHIPGVDGMGIVVAVGEHVKHIKIGARVCYHTNLQKQGSFSQHTIVSARAILAVPDNLSDEAAAAFPCPGLTAWQAMKKVPDLEGKDVLVSGAGGSVGYYLTQLLIDRGVRVYATASPKHHNLLLQRGVMQVFDYHDIHWHNKLQATLCQRPLYAAFDMVSGIHAVKLAPLLGYYGHLVCVQDRIEQAPLNAFSTSISLHEVALGAIHQFGSDLQWSELIQAGEKLLQMITCGQIKQHEFEVGQFDELPQKLTQSKLLQPTKKYLILPSKE